MALMGSTTQVRTHENSLRNSVKRKSDAKERHTTRGKQRSQHVPRSELPAGEPTQGKLLQYTGERLRSQHPRHQHRNRRSRDKQRAHERTPRNLPNPARPISHNRQIPLIKVSGTNVIKIVQTISQN